MGYRGYEHSGKTPAVPVRLWALLNNFCLQHMSATTGYDGSPDAWSAEVAFDITNTGKLADATVTQVYVAARFPKVDRPPKELKSFAKVNLRAGEKRRITLRLDKRALSYYDIASKEWRADSQFEVLVGISSDNIRLRQQFAPPETTIAENRSR